jgi:hypothetical protein
VWANAKARAARAQAGQQPNLLDDVMKDGQVHIANLEEVLADITGRTKAKSDDRAHDTRSWPDGHVQHVSDMRTTRTALAKAR